MSKLLHTPWKADIEGDIFDMNGGYEIDIVNSMGEVVGKAVGKVRETVEKNARVYAAAPEILEALIEANRFIKTFKQHMPDGVWKNAMNGGVEKMETIIKKATT